MDIVNGKTYRFINVYHDGYGLNIYGTKDTDIKGGQNVCLYSASTTDQMQQWEIEERGSNGYRLHAVLKPSYVLDCSDGSISTSYKNNAHMCAETGTTDVDCAVEFEYVSSNQVRIHLGQKGLCLTATTVAENDAELSNNISTSAALRGGSTGRGNVYWASPASEGSMTWKKQCWEVVEVGGGTDPDPEPGDGQNLIFPVNNARINVGYKVPIYLTDPRTAGLGQHYGSDYLDADHLEDDYGSDNIIASGDGVIYRSGRDDNAGYFACIVYPDALIVENGRRVKRDITVRYWHMCKLAIPEVDDYKNPEPIYKNDIIGTMGEEGVATGIHLHVECDTDTTPEYTFWTPTHFKYPDIIQNGTDSTINPGRVFQVGSGQNVGILRSDVGSWVLDEDYRYIGEYDLV